MFPIVFVGGYLFLILKQSWYVNYFNIYIRQLKQTSKILLAHLPEAFTFCWGRAQCKLDVMGTDKEN